MLTATITTTAKAGPGERALEQLLGLDGRSVAAGLFEPEQAAKGIRAEFGTSDVPARPWASVAADDGAGKLASVAERELGRVGDGRATGDQALQAIGDAEAAQLRDVILSGRVEGPALAPATVARKGNATKLVDTGDMLGAIEAKLDTQGGGDG